MSRIIIVFAKKATVKIPTTKEEDMSVNVSEESHQDEVRAKRVILPFHDEYFLYLDPQKVTKVKHLGSYLSAVYTMGGGTVVNDHT